MWNVKGEPYSAEHFGTFVPEKELAYYDGPLTFTFSGKNGEQFLANWCQNDDQANTRRFIVIPCDASLLASLENGTLPIRDALAQAKDTWIVDQDSASNNITSAWKIPGLQVIPEDALPPAGITLGQSPIVRSVSLSHHIDQGLTAAANFQQRSANDIAVDLLANAVANGRAAAICADPVKEINVTLTLRQSTHAALTEMAAKEGKTVEEIIARSLDNKMTLQQQDRALRNLPALYQLEMPSSLHDTLAAIAVQNGQSVNAVIAKILNDGVNRLQSVASKEKTLEPTL